MGTSGLKVISRFWNQFQTSSTVPRMINHGRQRESTSAQDRYWALSVRRHKRITDPQLTSDFSALSGRRISRQIVYSRLETFTRDIQSGTSL
ncbi:hypothetical protein TNCV_4134971 [Trichonephila clavipes]|nr:hypothetical protein TNCV_4134971 [Trichonephila clavipes]